MSDELLAHKGTLEVLEHLRGWLEAGEPFEEDDEVLAFREAKEREAHKNGKSAGEIIKTTGAGGNNTINEGELSNGNMFRVYASRDASSGKGSSSDAPRGGRQSDPTKCKNSKYRSENSRSRSIPKTVRTHNKYAQSFK